MDESKRIHDRVRELKGEITDFTRRLIQIPTVNPPGECYEECLHVLGGKLTELGIEWQKIDVPEESLPELAPKGEGLPRPSIIGCFGEGQRELHFHGHYDVVPSIRPDQFQAYVTDGKLYGRGATDMKGGLAVILFTLQVLTECDVRLNGTISVSFTPDEETGGVAGLKYLLDEGYINSSLIGVIDPEPSSGDIITGSRGALSFDVVIKGRASHVMTEHLGVNAFEKMADAVEAFRILKKRVGQRKTRCRVKPPGSSRSGLLLGGIFGGGTNFNIVPDRAFFSVDRRFNPEEKLSDVKAEIDEIVTLLQQRGIEIETEMYQEGEASVIEEAEPVCQALAEAVEQVKGRCPEVSMCPGLLETRFFVNSGIPAVVYGPGLLEQAHGPQEYVCLEDVYECVEIFALTSIALLGQ
jgi:succinyl-diaminopimelate desuccinylase